MSKKQLLIDLIITILCLGALAFFMDAARAAKIDYQLEVLVPKNCSYIVTSGFRTRHKNRLVGGAKRSYHLVDRARDVIFRSKYCEFKSMKNLKHQSDLSVIFYDDHVHVDNRKNRVCLIKLRNSLRYCAGVTKAYGAGMYLILDF